MGDVADAPSDIAKVHDRHILPLVIGLSVSLLVGLWAAAFATATTCSDNGGAHCDRVDRTLYVALGAAVVAGLIALFSPWPRRGRRVTYAAIMVGIALIAFVLMRSWSA